jgi:hypothetical protein
MGEMRYLESEGAWLIPPPAGESLEVLVAGNSNAPEPARLELVRRALAILGELRDRAAAYLDAFVDRVRFAKGNTWYLEGLEAGTEPGELASRLRLCFTVEGDTYGYWSVTFEVPPSEATQSMFFPVSFARRQV